MANRKKRLAKEEEQLKKELQVQSLLLVKKRQVKNHIESREMLVDYIASWFKNHGRFLNPPLGRDLENRYNADFMLDIRRLFNSNIRSENRRLFLVLIQHPKLAHCGSSFFGLLTQLFMKINPCRKLESWKVPKSKDELILFRSLYAHLFVRYDLAKCVLSEIKMQPQLIDLDKMIDFAQGLGIHKMKWSNFDMNGKVNFYFNNAPRRFSLVEAIWWAKIKSMQVNDSVAYCMIGQLQLHSETKWEETYEDFIFFVRKFNVSDSGLLKEIFNFLLYQKELKWYSIKLDEEVSVSIPALFPEFTLKGRSMASVLLHIAEWKKLIVIYKENGKNALFPIPKINEFTSKESDHNLTIKRLKGIKELADEGRIMKHCVYTNYAQDCISGISYIYSVKLARNGLKAKRVATVEVSTLYDKLSILEFQGKCNTPPSKFVIEKVKDWADREEIDYSENEQFGTDVN